MGLGIGQIIGISLPLISFLGGSIIYENSSFLLVVFLLAIYFYAYPLAPLRNNSIQNLRKYSVLVCGGWLTIILASQLQQVIIDVYKLEYSAEIVFFAKIILCLVNAQIGLEMIKRSHQRIYLPI